MFTYTGILKVKNKEQQVSERFRKREFVVSDNASSYPQTILFQLTQDRCSLLEDVNTGDEITVHFVPKGREWKNPQGEIKYFNSLDVFKIEKINKPSAEGEMKDAEFSNETLVPVPDDDLPF